MTTLNAETPDISAAPLSTEPLANGIPDQPAPPSAEGNGRSPEPAAPAGAQPAEAGAAPSGPSVAERGEEAVDNFAKRVGFFAAWGTRKLAGLASRTREVLQDFWAEVQDFRHGKKP
jgi:hypothetical protein